jgi:hypothetical protein
VLTATVQATSGARSPAGPVTFTAGDNSLGAAAEPRPPRLRFSAASCRRRATRSRFTTRAVPYSVPHRQAPR